MRGFIEEIAGSLYNRFGDDISSLTMVFPSRRARLFFSDALSRITPRPVWQPRFVSVDELMQRVAGVQTSDPVKLVTELYKVYSRYHNEPFDTFYFWGDMLLSDFNQIDKYMLDADMLFANIGDLRDIENDYSYLTAEQRQMISRFWQSFGLESEFSEEKQRFMSVWKTLAGVYHGFRDSLSAQGLAYEGMVHRMAADRIQSGEAVEGFGDGLYVVAGFNALTECEKRLFTWLQNGGHTQFYWDYDHYYVDNREHEAGLFLRDNISRFRSTDAAVSSHSHFSEHKEMVAVSAPSDSLQCKYVYTFLKHLLDRGIVPGKETAVVLTDESLLLPVLYSIPEEIGTVNVTMGYPLRQTTAYSFVERLIELQHRCRIKGESVAFYHSDVVGLLNHPYLMEHCGEQASRLVADIQRRQTVYVRRGRLQQEGLIGAVFTPAGSWQELAAYIRGLLSDIGRMPVPEGDDGQRREFFTLIIDQLFQVENSLADSGLDISVPVFASLLRKILQGVRVPYAGEPLAGVQVMGILETRNLDFEHVLILSMNDDTFPGNRAVSSSFVPHNLRLAYGLPTPQHHEGVYAYYFYRLIQRASTVHMVYCSRSDDKHTGEPSRYIYQLNYESPHTLVSRDIPLNVNLSGTEIIVVPKMGAVAEKLAVYLDGGGRTLSPTSFYSYIECPLRFYFRNIAGLQSEEEISEEIDLPMFGTILHKAMELLYQPLQGVANPQKRIAALVRSRAVDDAVSEAVNKEYLRDAAASEEDYGGNVILVRDIVRQYINSCVLPYDAAQEDFVIGELECGVECRFEFGIPENTHSVIFAGKSDRIDLLGSGLLRVVDYKTGARHLEFRDVEALFSADSRERSAAVLQTLLYSLMLRRSRGTDVQPALYYVRYMNEAGYSPLLVQGNSPVFRFSDYRQPLEEKLGSVLSELFDPEKPFTQCEDTRVCEYCDFKEICRR